MNSINRCNHTVPQQQQPNSMINVAHFQTNRGCKHCDNCSSRSSVSSHNSVPQPLQQQQQQLQQLSHHHHHHHMINNAPIDSTNVQANICNHQVLTCICGANHNNIQHGSSSLSESANCNLSFNLDGRNTSFLQQQQPTALQQSSISNCCSSNNNNHSHVHNNNLTKCLTQVGVSNLKANTQINTNTTTISRNALFYNPMNFNSESPSNGCGSIELNAKNHCQPAHQHPHHHHHHNLHNVQLSSSSSLSSLPPVDSMHRCNVSQNPNIQNTTIDLTQRPMNMINHCGHIHRAPNCNHQHHNQVATTQQLTFNNNFHGCEICSHTSNGLIPGNIAHQNFNTTNPIIGKSIHCSVGNSNNLYSQNTSTSRSEIISNEPLISTAHTHNLSNSSTTTHTSNVAVKHQPIFNQPLPSRGARSCSSQHYEQYGPSSAASTSSASMSNYHMPPGFEDFVPPYSTSKIRQPLPPPPANSNMSKSRPQTPSQMYLEDSAMHNNNFMSSTGNGFMAPFFQPTTIQQPQQVFNTAIPPLPPKPVSPNASTTSTQITTVRTSPSLHNQPITRMTTQTSIQNEPITRVITQADLQSPLPSSDVPPPLPPLNIPGSRSQPLVNSLMSKLQNDNSINNMSNIPNAISDQLQNINLNSNSFNRGNIITTGTGGRTESLTRQIGSEFQSKTGEAFGSCPKCNLKVLPGQEACRAMNQIYHSNCFVCSECNRTLLDKTFYPVNGKVYCEDDYKFTGHMQSLEKCTACEQPIYNMILQTMGKSYHPKCFKCCKCGECLDGVPFTIDMKNRIFCVKDYHSIYSPKCAACGKSISPIDDTGETVRVVSLDKDYHIDCYCCEDCGLPLTDEKPTRSYPLDNHLLCQQCHIKRLGKMQAALSLS